MPSSIADLKPFLLNSLFTYCSQSQKLTQLQFVSFEFNDAVHSIAAWSEVRSLTVMKPITIVWCERYNNECSLHEANNGNNEVDRQLMVEAHQPHWMTKHSEPDHFVPARDKAHFTIPMLVHPLDVHCQQLYEMQCLAFCALMSCLINVRHVWLKYLFHEPATIGAPNQIGRCLTQKITKNWKKLSTIKLNFRDWIMKSGEKRKYRDFVVPLLSTLKALRPSVRLRFADLGSVESMTEDEVSAYNLSIDFECIDCCNVTILQVSEAEEARLYLTGKNIDRLHINLCSQSAPFELASDLLSAVNPDCVQLLSIRTLPQVKDQDLPENMLTKLCLGIKRLPQLQMCELEMTKCNYAYQPIAFVNDLRSFFQKCPKLNKLIWAQDASDIVKVKQFTNEEYLDLLRVCIDQAARVKSTNNKLSDVLLQFVNVIPKSTKSENDWSLIHKQLMVDYAKYEMTITTTDDPTRNTRAGSSIHRVYLTSLDVSLRVRDGVELNPMVGGSVQWSRGVNAQNVQDKYDEWYVQRDLL